MIAIAACIKQKYECPYCLFTCQNTMLAFQGIHWGVRAWCTLCKKQFFFDLPVGHAGYDAYTVDTTNGAFFGPITGSMSWFARPLQDSLLKPSPQDISVQIRIKKKMSSVVIINCLDYLYGHSLLKLFNATRHLKQPKVGVIVIVPKCLAWCVPELVAEIWIVDVPLRKMQAYYPELEKKILSQLQRFKHVSLSKAYSHPHPVQIEDYTRVKPHVFESKQCRVTFIWRNDRPWFYNFYVMVLFRKLGMIHILLWWQRQKVIALFSKLRRKHPKVTWTVAGVGTEGSFPSWIADERSNPRDAAAERKLCQVYAESRVVIGVHGSNMLLPTAHAGSMINLLPMDRQGNFAQDVLFNHETTFSNDPRMLAFRYRFLSVASTVSAVASSTNSLLSDFSKAKKYFLPMH